MKYKGKKIENKNQEIIPFPRQGGDIIFIATALKDWSEFEKLVPEPTPPEILRPGGEKTKNLKDKDYIKKLDEYATLRTDFIILASLQGSPDLEWETIDMNRPSTWCNWRKELSDSGFTEVEQGRLALGVMRANSLDEGMIDEARANFLAGQQGSVQ